MSKTLLLADDSVTIQKVVGISFANEDVRIVTVDNGDDAVTRAREVKPDIVLADVVMPGKNGYDVCAAIKGDPELAGVPVLLLTGTFETFDEDRAARVGADGHITKPFEAQALVELVNARLAGAPVAKPAPAAPAPAEEEPEPFDFLEPEQDAAPARPGSAQPVSTESTRDAFGFEAEPLDTELEPEDDDSLGLGEETEARTTLLLEDDPLGEAETAPPAGFSARDFEGDELTHLVLPEGGETAAATARTLEPVATAPAPADDPLDSAFDPVLGDEDEVPAPNRAFDVSSSELGDSFRARAAGESTPQPLAAPAPAGFADPLFDDDEPLGGGTVAPPARPGATAPAAPAETQMLSEPPPSGETELSPQLRGQVHEALEKLAWEAFGDVSERIVKEAVERIEQVAWDVIPRLAETLIREEIRKLKGEE